jgi:hypothetical protein
MVTANLNTPLMVGQTGYTLTCDISGADNLNPTITYKWTRYDGTTHVRTTSNMILTFPHLQLSNAGDYNCSATVSLNSSLLNDDIMMNFIASHRVTIQGE